MMANENLDAVAHDALVEVAQSCAALSAARLLAESRKTGQGEQSPAFRQRSPAKVLHGLQDKLDRAVSGLEALVPIVFYGPACFSVGGTPYVTLCSQGAKEEGVEATNYCGDEAIEQYVDQLWSMMKESGFTKQLAWRLRPMMVECAGYKWYVRSRLAFI